jgi:hypothetical protein
MDDVCSVNDAVGIYVCAEVRSRDGLTNLRLGLGNVRGIYNAVGIYVAG